MQNPSISASAREGCGCGCRRKSNCPLVGPGTLSTTELNCKIFYEKGISCYKNLFSENAGKKKFTPTSKSIENSLNTSVSSINKIIKQTMQL